MLVFFVASQSLRSAVAAFKHVFDMIKSLKEEATFLRSDKFIAVEYD